MKRQLTLRNGIGLNLIENKITTHPQRQGITSFVLYHDPHLHSMKAKINCTFHPSKFIFLSFLLLSIYACNYDNNNASFDYGTKSDSARYYYLNGFHEILDNGRWTEAENSYRKALEFDPDYALGKSLVGRITRNLDEREKLLQQLLAIKNKSSQDENLLLDVYLLRVKDIQ